MLFQTSGDILHLVLAACIAVLTFFLCWALYYFISSVQRIHRVIKKVEAGVDKAEQLMDMIKDKVHNSASYVMMAGEIIKKVSELAKNRYEKKSEEKKSGKRKK
jgi:1,4-dihydroxy-2-naphthoate octaprenyltransferase